MDISIIPVMPQRQDSVADQLADLQHVAKRLGMYDAADAIGQWCKQVPQLRYGCHCDMEEGMEPDGCLIDQGRRRDCIYAKTIGRKEQCAYWKIISK